MDLWGSQPQPSLVLGSDPGTSIFINNIASFFSLFLVLKLKFQGQNAPLIKIVTPGQRTQIPI
jgi:hypothetical protein